MKLKIRVKRLARRDSARFIDRYFNEIIDYGGLPCTRGEAVLDMQRMGLTQPMIDRWLQRYELAQRLRERHECLSSASPSSRSVQVHLQPPPPSPSSSQAFVPLANPNKKTANSQDKTGTSALPNLFN